MVPGRERFPARSRTWSCQVSLERPSRISPLEFWPPQSRPCHRHSGCDGGTPNPAVMTALHVLADGLIERYAIGARRVREVSHGLVSRIYPPRVVGLTSKPASPTYIMKSKESPRRAGRPENACHAFSHTSRSVGASKTPGRRPSHTEISLCIDMTSPNNVPESVGVIGRFHSGPWKAQPPNGPHLIRLEANGGDA